MRLAHHRLYVYELRYARPVRWSDIVEDAAPLVALRLTSDSGHEGVGEITVKPTWCGVTARSLVAAIEDIFIPILKKLDLSDPAKIRAALENMKDFKGVGGNFSFSPTSHSGLSKDDAVVINWRNNGWRLAPY